MTTLTDNLLDAVRSKLRAWQLVLIALVLLAVVVGMAPAKLGLLLYGLGKLAAGAFGGYWIDRLLYPYARPHTLDGIAQGAACKRRAIIVAACILSMGLVP